MPKTTYLVLLGNFEPTPVPTEDTFAAKYVRRFEPWLTPDLETYLRAQAAMFDQVVLLAFDEDEVEGWTGLFDPLRCPAEFLPYLAQFVGERLPIGLDETGQREWISDAANRRRGTPQSVFLATQRHLTGGRLVSMYERYGGDVDVVAIRTNESETPSEETTRLDILSVLPADVVLDYSTTPGQTWDGIEGDTWDEVEVRTWQEVKSDLAGWAQYQRPRP